VVDALHGWEMTADDVLRCLHHPLEVLVISSGAAAEPGSNASREDALNGVRVKVSESFADIPNFCCLVPDLLSVGGLIIVGDEPQDGGVVRELNDGVGAVSGYRVRCEQGVQEGTECAALRGSGAQGQYRGGETAHSHYLGSARQEVQDPVAKGDVEIKPW